MLIVLSVMNRRRGETARSQRSSGKREVTKIEKVEGRDKTEALALGRLHLGGRYEAITLDRIHPSK